MGNMHTIRQYRSRAIQTLYGSQRIRDLLTDTVGTVTDGRSLVCRNIFPYAHIPHTNVDQQVIISLRVSVPRVYNKTYKGMRLYFYVYMPEDKMNTPNGLRSDLIAEEIDNLFNGSPDIGMGRVELNEVDDFAPIEGFYGILLVYSNTEFA